MNGHEAHLGTYRTEHPQWALWSFPWGKPLIKSRLSERGIRSCLSVVPLLSVWIFGEFGLRILCQYDSYSFFDKYINAIMFVDNTIHSEITPWL